MKLTAALVLGAVCSVPFAACSVSRVDARRITVAIGVATVVLGLLALTSPSFKP